MASGLPIWLQERRRTKVRAGRHRDRLPRGYSRAAGTRLRLRWACRPSIERGLPPRRANEPAADPRTPRETESGDRYCERGSSRSRSEKRRCQSAHLPDTLVVRPPTFLQQSSRRTAAELRPRPFEPSTNAVVVIASRQVGDDEREHVQPLGDVLGVVRSRVA